MFGVSSAFVFFGANILSDTFVGGRMCKPLNYLMLEKFLGGWLSMVASICCVV